MVSQLGLRLALDKQKPLNSERQSQKESLGTYNYGEYVCEIVFISPKSGFDIESFLS